MAIVERPGDRGILRRPRGTGQAKVPGGTVLDAVRSFGAVVRSLAAGTTPQPQPTPNDRVAGLAASGAAPGDFVAAAFEAYQGEIHSFALRSTRDPEAAADVTQDAFLKLLHEVGDGRTPGNVRAWLYRVVTNQVINRAKHLAVADRILRGWRRDYETSESPESTAIRAEQHQRLHDALETLSRDARVGLLLAAQGFSGREVASALGRTELATRTLLCRSRLQLRAVLGEGLEEATEAGK